MASRVQQLAGICNYHNNLMNKRNGQPSPLDLKEVLTVIVKCIELFTPHAIDHLNLPSSEHVGNGIGYYELQILNYKIDQYVKDAREDIAEVLCESL